MKPTPLTDKIMRLHKEAMHKLATPANELALQAAVESLERDRAELIEAMIDMMQNKIPDYEARDLLSRLGAE